MNLCLGVRVFVTLLDPSHWSSPRGFLSKTQEVRGAIDCPWEDHHGLPAATDILLRLSSSCRKGIGPSQMRGNSGIGPRLPNKPITRAN